jgi:hypothetical protein
MSPRSKREYIWLKSHLRDAIFVRYKHASRKAKTLILDEFCATSGYHRKHAIRVLSRRWLFSQWFKRFQKPTSQKKRGRPPSYHPDIILAPLKQIWLAANLPCSKRLKVILPLWLPGYTKLFGKLPPATLNALVRISPATIDRLLAPTRIHYTTRGRTTTKPGTLWPRGHLRLKKHIPIKTNQWDESRPGFLEADTVAHCGESVSGMFAYTIDCVDIATGWTEQRAVWGKGETGVLEQIKDIEQSLPFPLLGFDCDNGSEFLNYHLWLKSHLRLRHFSHRNRPIQHPVHQKPCLSQRR